MGTITTRKRGDGSTGYTAQIRIKRKGIIVHTEAQTFDRKAAAEAWLKKRETELAAPGAIEMAGADDPPLSDVIDRILPTVRAGTTKHRSLSTIKTYHIATLRCSQIGSAEISAFASEIAAARRLQPQSVDNYLAHLSPVFTVAKPLWKYPLNPQAMSDARVALNAIGSISASKQRDRRPTLDELDKILTWFGTKKYVYEASPPMRKVVLFALFSTRRQDEICRITWTDLDEGGSRILVRDMKHPDGSAGNDAGCELTPEALQIIKSMPRVSDRIFPYVTKSVSTAFTRACQMLAIDDLHFHDLRHEGISRLFELGRTIPLVAAVSGHRNWKSLQRYAQIRQTGDKYAGWPWLNVVVAGTL